MRKEIFKSFVFGLVMSLAPILHAETLSLTFQEALKLVLENNISLQSNKISVQQKKNVYDFRFNVFIPQIRPQASLGVNDRLFASAKAYPRGESDQRSLQLNLLLALNLPLGQIIPGLELTRIDYELATVSQEQLERQLTLQSYQIFHSLLALQANIGILEASLANALRSYQLAQNLYENGVISEVDLLQAQVNYERAKPALNQAGTDYRESIFEFLRLLNKEQNNEVELLGDLETLPPLDENIDIEKLWAIMREKRVDMRQLYLSKDFNDKDYELQLYGSIVPLFSTELSWGTSVLQPFESGTQSWQRDNFKDQLGVKFSLGWELSALFDNSTSGIQRQNNRLTDTDLNLRIAKLWQDSQGEVLNNLASLRSYSSELESNQLSRDLALRNFQLNQQSYEQGVRTLQDVDDARISLLQAEQILLGSKLNMILSGAQLLYNLGLSSYEELQASLLEIVEK